MNAFHINMSWVRMLRTALVLAVCLLVLVVPDAWATGNDVGRNVGELLKHYAGEVYGGLVAAVGLVFLWNRRYVELAVFLFAAIVVGWMVFAPSTIGDAAKVIAHQVFG